MGHDITDSKPFTGAGTGHADASTETGGPGDDLGTGLDVVRILDVKLLPGHLSDEELLELLEEQQKKRLEALEAVEGFYRRLERSLEAVRDRIRRMGR